jgi:CrcB protein
MIALLGVAGAGALGAVARFVVDRQVMAGSRRTFPLGTFVINATGSFVLGLLAGLYAYQGMSDLPKTIAGVGFCGAFTTFSTFCFETVRLVEEGSGRTAALNVGASLVVGLLAAGAGLALAAVV